MLERYYGNESEKLKEKAKNGVDLKDFSKLPFCIINNRVGITINKCFEEAGYTPTVYTTSSYVQINEFICFTGLAASFSTRTSLHNLRDIIPEDINIFPLYYKGEPLRERTSIICHKERYLCHYNQYFFDLILNYFQKLESLPIKQLITSGLKKYYAVENE